MMRPPVENKAFKRAVVSSVIVHVGFFILIIVSPSLPKPPKKGTIHYLPLNMVGVPGGGGGGGEARAAAPVGVKKETLRDLTTPQKLKEEPRASVRYPVEKPKKELKKKIEKKAVISKPETTVPKEVAEKSGTAEGAGGAIGSGLKIGGIGPGSGSGSGGGYGDQIGLSNFPFTYYLQIITDRVSANWFTSLVDPGISGNFQTVIYFKILKNGQISDLMVEQSSGIKSLDMSAQRAVQNSGPFPALPAEFEGEFLAIHLIFEHSK